jgi:DNA polymerase III subunit epsilon
MDPAAPLATAEFLVVDTETNGLGGDRCELTEVGAVLVGGGELHDRWDSLVAARTPLSRGIQRFTGISQAMLDQAPAPEEVMPQLAQRMRGRVLVAHSASFDRRVLRQAFERAGVEWP